MYELTRKQEKFPEINEYFTVEGSCEFVGEFLLTNLPEHETEALKDIFREKYSYILPYLMFNIVTRRNIKMLEFLADRKMSIRIFGLLIPSRGYSAC